MYNYILRVYIYIYGSSIRYILTISIGNNSIYICILIYIYNREG